MVVGDLNISIVSFQTGLNSLNSVHCKTQGRYEYNENEDAMMKHEHMIWKMVFLQQGGLFEKIYSKALVSECSC
jgi:hypothetical protein